MAVRKELLESKPLTYEDYLALPEIKGRYDIIDGEIIFMSPGPTSYHQWVSLKLTLILAPFVLEHNLGKVFYAPLDIVIRRKPLRTRQPDLMFIRAERVDAIVKDMVEGGPDLVIEILSPTNSRAEIEQKLRDYAGIGVSESWLVSPEARTIEILRLTKKSWKRQGIYGLGEKITSPLLPGFSLKVSEIFD